MFNKQKDKKTGKPKIWLYRNKETGESKGEATITYDDSNAAKSAISWFDNKNFNGASIHVSLAQRQNTWQKGGSFRGGNRGGGGFNRDGGNRDGGSRGGFNRDGGGGRNDDRRGPSSNSGKNIASFNEVEISVTQEVKQLNLFKTITQSK